MQTAIGDFLKALFTVKTTPSEMEKFGQSSQKIIEGIANLLIITCNKYEEATIYWL
jgi:hypothetical protein